MELFTACCRYSQLLLKDDEHKKIVLQSLAFLCNDQRIRLYGYVILEDEFHVLWEKLSSWKTRNIRQMMLKYTAQQIKHRLLRIRSPILEEYRSTLNDRHYHFWDKAIYFTPMRSLEMAAETIHQLHEAPISSGLCASPEEYPFSSAGFYYKKHGTSSPNLTGNHVTNIQGEMSISAKGEITTASGSAIETSSPALTEPRLHVVKNGRDQTCEAYAGSTDRRPRDKSLIRITGEPTAILRSVVPEKTNVKLIYKSLTAGDKCDVRKSRGHPGLIALLSGKTEWPLIITDFQTAFTTGCAGPEERR